MYSILPSKVKISVFFPMGLPTIDQELIQSDPTSCPQNQREITNYKN